MAQGVLPFKYQREAKADGATALGGLPLYLELAHVLGLGRSIHKHVGVRRASQGWGDAQVVMALVLLHLAGGDCVDDLRRLEADQGFARRLRRVELAHLCRCERRQIERRWLREGRRSVPSASAVFRYLARFHDPEQETLRRRGQAFMPVANEHLRGLRRVNADLVAAVQRRSPSPVATLDVDATLVASFKKEALPCEQGYKA